MTFGSLFSGVGGFDFGLERAGMDCAWTVEYDKQARSVLRKQWPDVPHYEDVHNVGPSQLAPVNLICGGFPCQDYSVAGKRGGLVGDRGALWWQMHRIIAECRPEWVVGENVPGLLSSNGGRDFLTIIASLVELGYGVTWATLDSQYFGVAQRRRRLFIVGHLGGIPRPEILALSEGLRGHPAPSREAGEGVAACPGVRSASGSDERGGLSSNIQVTGVDTYNSTLSGNVSIPVRASAGQRPIDAPCVMTHTAQPVAFTPESVRMDGTREDGTHHPLRCSGHAAIAIQQNSRSEVRLIDGDGGIVGALAAAPGVQQQNYIVGAHPRRCSGHAAIAFATQQTPKGFSSETVPTLQVPSRSGGGQPHAVLSSVPRRLTPVECERLQGFPDGWTARGTTDEGKAVELADGPRYRMMGNAVTVNVAEWIAHRIMKADV